MDIYLELAETIVKPLFFVFANVGEIRYLKKIAFSNNIEIFPLSMYTQVLGVNRTKNSMKVIGDLWRSRKEIFRINIELQMFKYLKRFSFLVIDIFLDQSFEAETNFEKQVKIGSIITWKKTTESYGILN